MRCAEGEGRLSAGPKVGLEGIRDAGVSLRQVVLKRTYKLSVSFSHSVRVIAYQSSRTRSGTVCQLTRSRLRFRRHR
jgi:hypothetical protein